MSSPIPPGRPIRPTSAESSTDWLQRHAREIVLAVAAVAVVGGGFFAYRQISAGNEQRAEQALFAAQQTAMTAEPEQGVQALQQVVTGHGGTSAGAQAALQLAQLLYDQGKYDEGLRVLDGVSGSHREFGASIQALVGAGHEGSGRYADAAAAYRRAAEAARFDEDRQSYLTEAARVLALAGDREGAIRIWTEIADDPTSPHAPEARVRLGELQARPASNG